MFMTRRTPGVAFTLWCLLLLWIFFGGLELAEQFHLVQETAAEDQEHPDLDAEALSQLASGLKSAVPNRGAPCDASAIIAVAEPTVSHACTTVHQLTRLMRDGSPSRPLHQLLGVYRI